MYLVPTSWYIHEGKTLRANFSNLRRMWQPNGYSFDVFIWQVILQLDTKLCFTADWLTFHVTSSDLIRLIPELCQTSPALTAMFSFFPLSRHYCCMPFSHLPVKTSQLWASVCLMPQVIEGADTTQTLGINYWLLTLLPNHLCVGFSGPVIH